MKIQLPQVGESVTEGIIGKWLKEVGSKVEKFDPLVEVVTDKVAMELPSPVTGILKEIVAFEGETVPMGAILADIETNEQDSKKAASTEDSVVPNINNLGTTGILLKDTAPVGPTGSGGQTNTGGSTAEEFPEKSQIKNSARFSPAVLRLAQEHDIDLSLITATGRNNRITRKDVQSFIDSGSISSSQENSAVESIPEATQPISIYPSELNGDQRVKLTPIRKMIASNMVKSASLIPQAWSLVEVDVSGMVSRRRAIREEFKQREGINITYLPFVIKAVAESLKENPLLNSSWGEDSIIMKSRINIGIAIATKAGLVVPVIHDADTLSIAGLARSVENISTRSREGTLTVDDVRGGTFTVNNTGVLGSVASQPLVNYPQAAIMTTEAIVKRPVIVADAIAIRSMMNICLSFDHRIMDGQEVGEFATAVKRRLEVVDRNTPVY
ncbi:MAG: hypothetical protein BZY65_00810 [SAR202 cluster bacterium Ae2-Chloro-G2]|nr:MAG: hypothetical protein BZY65_00810 [SAR202 cluster bacterium Ae2-Chloro-G2]